MGLTHRSLVSPCHSFFPFSLFFSLCSSFRMTPWNTGALLAFWVNQGRSSLFLFPFYFPYRLCHHPEGTPGSCWGWTRKNPMHSMKRKKDRTFKDELPRLEGAQFATGDHWELTPERMKRRSQSKNNTRLWMWLVMDARSNAIKSNIA